MPGLVCLPTLPSWISQDQPLYLNATICARVRKQFSGLQKSGKPGIFLNIPYSRRYSNLEIAIISTVTAYDLTPRMARERSRTEARLLKIAELMLTCQYGLTDLSYVKRMNMPLELGLLLAFGKETFIMSGKRYSALRTISDMNFSDIHYHEGGIRHLIRGLSLWIEQTRPTKRLTTRTLVRRYRRCRQIRESLGDDLDRLTPDEISGMLGIAGEEFQMRLRET